MGARRRRRESEREPTAEAVMEEELRREAEAHFRWAREVVLQRAAETHDEPEPEPEPDPEAVADGDTDAVPDAAVEAAEPAESSPGREEPEVVEHPALWPGLRPALEAEWRHLDLSRRELAAEWARLGAARERIETAYDRLDFLREQLDAECRQLERVWAERLQLVSETQPAAPRSVATDPSWRSAASLLLEAVAVMRTAVGRREREPSGHGDDADHPPGRIPRELRPGDA